jgi:aspartate racemase
MKTIGLLGGMSWESTADYYRFINEGIKRSLGGLHSAEIVLRSLDFAAIEHMQRIDDWPGMATSLGRGARQLQAGGADCILICTNTMHKVAPEVAAAVDIPLLHVADATGEALVEAGIRSVGLLGARFTMEQGFYKNRLAERYGLDVRVPAAAQREQVHRVIFDELCLGCIADGSRKGFLDVIDGLALGGAEAVILGCTEIGMLVEQADTDVRLFDTTRLHAEAAVSFAIDGVA